MSESVPMQVKEDRAFQEGDMVDAFLNHYNTTHGWMRTAIIRWALERFVSQGGPLRVADIGCGDARESIWLASMGHSVVAVDPSTVMIDRARALWSQKEKAQVAGSLDLRIGNEGSVRDEFSLGFFDLVLSHGVLMYQAEPLVFLKRHAELLRDGGHLSLLTTNALSLPIDAALDGNPEQALRYLTERRSVGRLGQATVSNTLEELQVLLHGVGLRMTNWFGVRIFSDRLDETVELSDVDRNAYLELEKATATLDPYRSMARGLLVIARAGHA